MRQDRIERAVPLFAALLLAAPLAASPPAPGDVTSDASLAQKVDAAILHSPLYGPFDLISYQVNGDTVTLGGEVFQPTLRDQTEKAVAAIPGVTRVVDRIEVLPPSSFDDQVRRAVFVAIYRDSRLENYGTPLDAFRFAMRGRALGGVGRALEFGLEPLGSFAIHVVVNGGRVTLYGRVDNEVDRNRAALDARRVFGVTGVENRIEVNPRTGAA